MSDDPLTDCPECQTPSLKRKIGLGAGIIFKGGGFYETDFKEKKGSSGDSPAKSEKPAKAEEKSGTAPEKKPAAAAGKTAPSEA